MSPDTPLAPEGVAEARPVDDAERLVLLDVLRGFALAGVFVSNVAIWFSGRTFFSRAQAEAFMASASLVDKVAAMSTAILVSGKFITLFSFLFGLGFSIQLFRAEARGTSIAPLYMRRLGVMLLIGAAHLFLLWYGDILSTYALLGFALLLFHKRQDRTLLVWAALLICVLPPIFMGVPTLLELLSGMAPEARAAAEAAAKEQTTALKTQTLEVFQSGGYFEVVGANAAYYFRAFVDGMVYSLPPLLGRFLLGLLAGRRRLFHAPSEHRPFFRKLLWGGLGVGVVTSGAVVVVWQLMRLKLIPEGAAWVGPVMMTVRQVAELGVAAFYVACLTLLFLRPAWQQRLVVLAPVGRMALTNYLTQTVASLLFFYGFGLGFITTLGPAACVALTLAFFSLQVVFSHLWLARFRFGPAEWLWRSLTYGKAQPMRRAPEPGVAVAAVG
jgi:uncharacterized protein